MKCFTPLQMQLIDILSDGRCHSGQYLGNTLGISRTAIWKHIEKLETLGLMIKRIPKQGYHLENAFIPLSKAHIQNACHTGVDLHDLHLFASIDSTSRFLKNQPFTSSLTCCIAETQTAGRGRFRRHWHSPFGENIYCSLGLRIEGDPSRLSGLSLVVSLAMHAVFQQYTQQAIDIKWPNDLLWNHQKLAGTLIEMTAEGNGGTDIIIGMGLNINSISSPQDCINRPWCSLKDITHQSFDRNQLIAELISALDEHLQVFIQQGFTPFIAAWNALDYLSNKTVTISQPNRSITGQGRGVNHAGYLMLEDDKGVTHVVSSGDTTLAQGKT
ncbi:MAG: biotin--[acetyl-CoA-carboxylase] ligase [Gammaproteobacteria bacterium]|nr:biotin--[acetyl-CoA-carboxylase] ligase [Gammaproteobacteria bacterium]MCH9764025.1 biotin--[acetyl-CoA-carboxylase] ligase [Gammaproteobacteria bacterium]